ncbi:hypothetical protein OG321_39270 [Streptomyces sp. NBC_00424]|uniref:hypothetical protein n=1 Tax=Streptomyces sp. NBC_00424 TaxID=2903648 RepID=UPI002255B863|nr:hypothetical protein [Streptomyces sp. NBC_00424]MCX5078481.1 hypothetical protein [Streptomyces sp. NBC_00424]
MQDWNTPDHTIADIEHGTLLFAGDVPLVIAGWEAAPAASRTRTPGRSRPGGPAWSAPSSAAASR